MKAVTLSPVRFELAQRFVETDGCDDAYVAIRGVYIYPRGYIATNRHALIMIPDQLDIEEEGDIILTTRPVPEDARALTWKPETRELDIMTPDSVLTFKAPKPSGKFPTFKGLRRIFRNLDKTVPMESLAIDPDLLARFGTDVMLRFIGPKDPVMVLPMPTFLPPKDFPWVGLIMPLRDFMGDPDKGIRNMVTQMLGEEPVEVQPCAGS